MSETGWRVVLMKNQGAVGASYITTREHRADIDELTDQEWVELRDIVRILTEATKRQFGARHMNISCDMNDAAAAGTPTHVHFKLRGRGSRLIQSRQSSLVMADMGQRMLRVMMLVSKPYTRFVSV